MADVEVGLQLVPWEVRTQWARTMRKWQVTTGKLNYSTLFNDNHSTEEGNYCPLLWRNEDNGCVWFWRQVPWPVWTYQSSWMENDVSIACTSTEVRNGNLQNECLELYDTWFFLFVNQAVIYTYIYIILPFVLYGCETWSCTVNEEHRLRIFIVAPCIL